MVLMENATGTRASELPHDVGSKIPRTSRSNKRISSELTAATKIEELEVLICRFNNSRHFSSSCNESMLCWICFSMKVLVNDSNCFCRITVWMLKCFLIKPRTGLPGQRGWHGQVWRKQEIRFEEWGWGLKVWEPLHVLRRDGKHVGWTWLVGLARATTAAALHFRGRCRGGAPQQRALHF